jgi:aurora kinase
MQGVCKVCDFGWAAICEDRRQTYCGTLDYVCPEIVEGNSYDSGVDVWCVGVLAYELMCGKAPFYDISRKKTIEKIKTVLPFSRSAKYRASPRTSLGRRSSSYR